MKKASALPGEIKGIEDEIEEKNKRLKWILMRIPNILHESVPIGKSDEDNVQIRSWGEPKILDFELKPNGILAEELGLADFDRAAKISGSGFVFVRGDLAMLDLALQRFAIDVLRERGFIPIEVPLMMRRKPYEGVIDISDFENVMYKIDKEDLYMIATSEHPIAAMFMNEIIDEDKLPLKFAGISPCFRKEVGKHGIDTKGFFRMHQFNKVEQFVFSIPEQSWKVHEELIANAEYIFQQLKIPYRIVNVCTGDIGSVAAKKYDLEAWSPRQKKYIEVVSCSNCTDYQARRLNIRCGKPGGSKRVLHTLNSTAIATSRAIVAILENYQQRDGSVIIPEILRRYMDGKKVLEPIEKI